MYIHVHVCLTHGIAMICVTFHAYILAYSTCTCACTCTVQWKTFEGENYHEFCALRATSESFLHVGMSHPPTCMQDESFLSEMFTSY